MNKAPYISVLSIVLILSGCGNFAGKNAGQNEDVLPETTAPSTDIRWLTLEDPSCLQNGSSIPIANATIYEWDGYKTSPKVVPFPGRTVDQTDFGTINVMGAAINYTQNYKCTLNNAGERKCVDNTKDKTENNWLRICRASGVYGRDSIEAMTLTAMHYTEAAYNFYNSITGNMPGITKSIMISQPKINREIIKTNGDVKNRVDSDNAAFAELPGSAGKPSYGLFMIYPTTQRWFATNKNNLWEVPFVMQHEFGHHVFSHYIKDKANSIGLSLKSSSELQSIMPNPDKTSRARMSLTSSADTAQLALDGINEAYADLYGYFSGNSARDQLRGIECLAVSRDPSSPVTKGGQPKGLDQTRIDIYEGRRSASTTTNDCYEPAFDDEHDIAVALGQPLARFIETLAPQANGNFRARFLLVWATRMQGLINQGSSNISVDTLVRELILGAKSLVPNTSLACSDLKPRISGLKSAVAACNL